MVPLENRDPSLEFGLWRDHRSTWWQDLSL